MSPSAHITPAHRMSWLSRLLGGRSESEVRPQRLDYLSEALVLERQGDYDAALTSYRLALRDTPNDLRVLQNMAIAFSRTGRLEEAVRAYRRALEIDPSLAGAHYGLAFLLLKRGDNAGALKHLRAFLAGPPSGEEAERWIRHAQATLEQLGHPTGGATPSSQG
jgi:tetratricopeptide (TPR) repeat protein